MKRVIVKGFCNRCCENAENIEEEQTNEEVKDNREDYKEQNVINMTWLLYFYAIVLAIILIFDIALMCGVFSIYNNMRDIKESNKIELNFYNE